MKRRKHPAASSEPEAEDESGSSNGKHTYRHRAQSLIDSKALDELETEVFETGLYENLDLSRGSRFDVMTAEIIYSEYTTGNQHGLTMV